MYTNQIKRLSEQLNEDNQKTNKATLKELQRKQGIYEDIQPILKQELRDVTGLTHVDARLLGDIVTNALETHALYTDGAVLAIIQQVYNVISFSLLIWFLTLWCTSNITIY